MSKNSGVLLLVLFIVGVIEYYAFTAVNTALRTVNTTTKNIILIVYVLLAIAALLGILTIRHWHITEWSATLRTIILPLFMGFVLAQVIAALIMMIDDVRRLIVWVYHLFAKSLPVSSTTGQTTGISRSQFIARSAVLVGGLMLGGIVWGTRNKYRYKVKKIKISLKDLPASFKGFKIIQISDIHSGSFDDANAVSHGVDLIMRENADLILFTGDLVNDVATEIEPYKPIFSKLKAPMGVYSTLGNHDYGDYAEWASKEDKMQNLERLKQHHADMGWNLMLNEHKILERNGEKIALLGVENWSASSRFHTHGDLKKAYEGLQNENIPVKILMSHDPSHWDAEIRKSYKDINLTLSGHTHGMQFGVLLPWMKWSPIKYMYKQWAGLYTENNQHLYVNVGYGFLGYPGRLGILPEITVIELV